MEDRHSKQEINDKSAKHRCRDERMRAVPGRTHFSRRTLNPKRPTWRGSLCVNTSQMTGVKWRWEKEKAHPEFESNPWTTSGMLKSPLRMEFFLRHWDSDPVTRGADTSMDCQTHRTKFQSSQLWPYLTTPTIYSKKQKAIHAEHEASFTTTNSQHCSQGGSHKPSTASESARKWCA